jgi:hypothetical protein
MHMLGAQLQLLINVVLFTTTTKLGKQVGVAGDDVLADVHSLH